MICIALPKFDFCVYIWHYIVFPQKYVFLKCTKIFYSAHSHIFDFYPLLLPPTLFHHLWVYLTFIILCLIICFYVYRTKVEHILVGWGMTPSLYPMPERLYPTPLLLAKKCLTLHAQINILRLPTLGFKVTHHSTHILNLLPYRSINRHNNLIGIPL